MTQHSIPDVPATLKMSELIRAKDWSKTILGPTEKWPPSLSLLVNVMLASGFPMAVRWGPEFVMIYNDGYAPILGDKHPWGLGLPFAEVWPEVQATLRPLHEAILSGRRGAFFAEDLLLRIQRHGAEWGKCPKKATLAGWGARIRTWEWWNQNPLPYHLATPQSAAGLPSPMGRTAGGT
jgi:hypothetical protein